MLGCIDDFLLCLISRYFLFHNLHHGLVLKGWSSWTPLHGLVLINFLNPLSTLLQYFFVVFALSVYDLWKVESGRRIHIWCKSSVCVPLREGSRYQNGWFFGKVPKGGIQKCLLQSVFCFDFSQHNCRKTYPVPGIYSFCINFMLKKPYLKFPKSAI